MNGEYFQVPNKLISLYQFRVEYILFICMKVFCQDKLMYFASALASGFIIISSIAIVFLAQGSFESNFEIRIGLILWRFCNTLIMLNAFIESKATIK